GTSTRSCAINKSACGVNETCRLRASFPSSTNKLSRQCNRSVDGADHTVAIDLCSACMTAPRRRRLVINRDFFLEARQVANPQVNPVTVGHRRPGSVGGDLPE